MYKCEHFKAQELVDKALYEKRGNKVFQLFDDRLLKLIDELRELFGVPMTVNSWLWGGNRTQSGLRTSGSKYYSPTSQHSLGRAVDFLVKGMSADEARRKIEAWHNRNANGIATIAPSITMEADVSWVHLDIRNNPDGVNYFNA